MAKFADCATILLLQHPFFASLLMKFKHIEDTTLNPPTLAVSANTIRYHPEFFASQTDEVGVFGIAHEIMHAVYMHLDRMRHYATCGIGPDGHPYDHPLMNIACDYPINNALHVSKVGTVPDWCYHDAVKYPYTMTPEEVYCLLKKNGGAPKPKPGSGPSGPGQGGAATQGDNPDTSGFDTHDWQADAQELPAVTAAEVMEAANVCSASRGTLPAGIDRLIGSIKKPSVSPWRRLRQLVVSVFTGNDATTWKKLQRKMIVRGIGVPGMISHGAGRIGVVVDISGSIGQEMLNLFAGHMAAIMEDARPKEAFLFWTDTHVRRTDKVLTSTQLRNMLTSHSFKAPGGGGTDMPKGVQAAIDAKCDAVVVLTDGFTPFGEPQKRRVIWAITTAGVDSPHGHTVHIT